LDLLTLQLQLLADLGRVFSDFEAQLDQVVVHLVVLLHAEGESVHIGNFSLVLLDPFLGRDRLLGQKRRVEVLSVLVTDVDPVPQFVVLLNLLLPTLPLLNTCSLQWHLHFLLFCLGVLRVSILLLEASDGLLQFSLVVFEALLDLLNLLLKLL
jgi:hypothetical protein